MPGNETTVMNDQVILKDLDLTQHIPVECDMSDSDTSVQTQFTNIPNFSREEVVPLYIWADRNSSKDKKACIQQNGDQFGYIPLYDRRLYHGPEVRWHPPPPLFYRHIN